MEQQVLKVDCNKDHWIVVDPLKVLFLDVEKQKKRFFFDCSLVKPEKWRWKMFISRRKLCRCGGKSEKNNFPFENAFFRVTDIKSLLLIVIACDRNLSCLKEFMATNN